MLTIPRLLLSLAIALVVGLPMAQVIYSGSINNELSETTTAHIHEATNGITRGPQRAARSQTRAATIKANRDFLARQAALARVEKASPGVTKYVQFFPAFLIAIDLVALMLKLTHLFSTGGAYEESAAALRANDLVEVHRLQQRANVPHPPHHTRGAGRTGRGRVQIPEQELPPGRIRDRRANTERKLEPPPAPRRLSDRHPARRLTTDSRPRRVGSPSMLRERSEIVGDRADRR